MRTFSLATLDLANLDDRYEAEIHLDGRTVKLDVNFATKTLTSTRAKAVEQFLAKIGDHARAAKRFVDEHVASETDTTVRDFLDFHLDELPPEVVATLIDPASTLAKDQQLLAKLVVERVGLYPDANGDGFAVFDHTFDGNTYEQGRRTITDQIIAVYVDAGGVVGHLSHES